MVSKSPSHVRPNWGEVRLLFRAMCTINTIRVIGNDTGIVSIQQQGQHLSNEQIKLLHSTVIVILLSLSSSSSSSEEEEANL